MIVVARIFSGRPDPRWPLAQPQTERLLARLQELQALREPFTIAPDGLGYRGLVVTSENDASAFDVVHVFDTKVMVRRGEVTEVLADPNRQLESWLLVTGEGHVDAETHELLKQQLQRGAGE